MAARRSGDSKDAPAARKAWRGRFTGPVRLERSASESDEPMSPIPKRAPHDHLGSPAKPSRRVTALATLAFASAVTGPAAGASTAAAAKPRTAPPAPRSANRPAGSLEATRATTGEARLELPADLDLVALADALGVHPGRLRAALSRLTPDASRSVGGLDPLTALAQALRLPPTDVYLAVARLAAGTNR
jgi:hypothetical protein